MFHKLNQAKVMKKFFSEFIEYPFARCKSWEEELGVWLEISICLINILQIHEEIIQ